MTDLCCLFLVICLWMRAERCNGAKSANSRSEFDFVFFTLVRLCIGHSPGGSSCPGHVTFGTANGHITEACRAQEDKCNRPDHVIGG